MITFANDSTDVAVVKLRNHNRFRQIDAI